MTDLGRAPDRINVNVQRGFPFRASLKMRDGSDWEVAPEIRLDSGGVWPSTISGDVASWDIPATTVDAARHAEHVKLVLGDVLWGEGRLQEDVGVGFGGRSQVLVLPHPDGGQAITSPAVKGDQGETPTLISGTATTLDPEDLAEATLVPAGDGEYRLDLAIPRGSKGEPGGSDAAMADWIETGTLTPAALAAAPAITERAKTSTLPVLLNGVPGIDMTGATDSTVALQNALDSALAQGRPVTGFGVIRTNATIRIASNVDLSSVTVRYYGSGVAVILGSETEVVYDLDVRLPKVMCMTKPSPGWIAGTVGVKAVNLNSCANVVVSQIMGFEVGLLVYGQGQGNSYNNFFIGFLNTNKINLRISADTTGWSNQNSFIGGRYNHSSNEGVAVSGARHIHVVSTLPNPANNNTFINASLEGNTPEYHLDTGGNYNMWQACRWETNSGVTPKVVWRSGATRNQIIYGSYTHLIVQTVEAGANSNHVISAHTAKLSSVGTGPVLQLQNQRSATDPADVVMSSSALVSDDPFTSYSVARSADNTKMKRPTDAHPRTQLNHLLGQILFGGGAAAPTLGVGIIAGDTLHFIGVGVSTTAPTAGAAGALPAAPAGYMTAYIDGAIRKIPYY